MLCFRNFSEKGHFSVKKDISIVYFLIFCRNIVLVLESKHFRCKISLEVIWPDRLNWYFLLAPSTFAFKNPCSTADIVNRCFVSTIQPLKKWWENKQRNVFPSFVYLFRLHCILFCFLPFCCFLVQSSRCKTSELVTTFKVYVNGENFAKLIIKNPLFYSARIEWKKRTFLLVFKVQ